MFCNIRTILSFNEVLLDALGKKEPVGKTFVKLVKTYFLSFSKFRLRFSNTTLNTARLLFFVVLFSFCCFALFTVLAYNGLTRH